MIAQAELDSLLAQEIDRRLGASGDSTPPVEALRALLHVLRGSASLAGHSDLALVATQLGQRLKAGELDLVEGVASLLRRAAIRLKQGRSPFDSAWPEPPEGLQPSVVAPELRAEYVGTMRDRARELQAVAFSDIEDPERLARAGRIVHTMKSLAASVGDDATAWYCHHLEAKLRRLTEGSHAHGRLEGEIAAQSDTLRRLIEDPEAAFAKLRVLRTADVGSGLEVVVNRNQGLGMGPSRSPSEVKPGATQDSRLVSIQPARTTFTRVLSRCERAALRFAESEGKCVTVETLGGDFPMDDSVCERLIEPLLQIVKNAITHGIESPEQRCSSGKPVEGLLRLSAERHGAGIRILIEDDGAGVDLEIVRRRAIERGISNETDARRLGEDELLGLLFVPGLSTLSQPNLLSGRGMGLDLSRDVVMRMGGCIRVSVRSQGGVCVTLDLPESVVPIESNREYGSS